MRLAGIFVQTHYQLINALNVAKNVLNMDGCFLFLREEYYLSDKKFRLNTKDSFIKGVFYTQSPKDFGKISDYWIRLRGVLTGNNHPLYTTYCAHHKTIPVFMPRFSVLIGNKFDGYLLELYNQIYCKTDVYIIEDGIGDYIYGYKNLCSNYNRIFYNHEFYNKEFQSSCVNLPSISVNNYEFFRILNNIYPLTEFQLQQIESCQCVYFHQPLDRDASEEEKTSIILLEKKLIDKLSNKYGDGFFIKLHPRDEESLFSGYNHLISDVPWEAMIIKKTNPQNILLVGLYSTTLVSPKYLFGYEPHVITLEKVWRYWTHAYDNTEIKRMDDLFENLRTIYLDKKKIIIPENIEELSDCIDSL